MIKFAEIPDLHFDPVWSEITEQIINNTITECTKNEIDFIVLPGDITNRTLYASEKGGINQLRKLIKKLTLNFPVAAIYGTPSHESSGSLDHLKDCGLVILQPNNIYGYFKKNKIIREIPGPDALDLSCILFGIPELNNKRVQKKYKLQADQANAKTLELLEKHIKEYIAPRRMRYNDIPAVCLLHGIVSDSIQSNETDNIKKRSNLLIHTEILELANIDRWSLGDIHTPWESEKISAGYAGFTGIDNNPWGKTGFKPAFNLVEINRIKDEQFSTNPNAIHIQKPKITRIPYGTPERIKIKQLNQATNKDIAYWLDTINSDIVLPEFVHSWSKVTYNPKQRNTQRISEQQAEKITCLSDLFELIDPKVTKRILSKVRDIETTIPSISNTKINAVLSEIEISGCDFFNGRTVKLNIDKLSQGLTGISSDNNGDGKSGLLSFFSWYPVTIGKDTDSGRISAVKDFFSGKDSRIKKVGYVNGKKHEHLITIRGANTKTPKFEGYIFIEGHDPILEKGTFDEMFSECEKLYGPFKDYQLTSFYIQPQQSTKNINLMNATMTDIRNLVQSIAGVDRENEKREALNKVSETEKAIEQLENWLSGVSEFEINIQDFENQLVTLNNQKDIIQKDINKSKIKMNELNKQYKTNIELKIFSDSEVSRKEEDLKRIETIEKKIENNETEIFNLELLSSNLNINIEKLNNNIQLVKENEKINKIIFENKKLQQEYHTTMGNEELRINNLNQKAENEYNKTKKELESNIKAANTTKEANKKIILCLNKPCEKCGHLDSKIEKDIIKITQQNKKIQESIDNDTMKLSELTKPLPIKLKPIPQPELSEHKDLNNVLSLQEIEELEKFIASGREATVKISSAKENINADRNIVTSLQSSTYKINPNLEEIIINLNKEIENLNSQISNENDKLISIKTQIESIDNSIKKANEVSFKIETTKKQINKLSTELSDWDYIAKMLQSNKIPALELDLITESIDKEATRIIKPYQESRFSFQTITQSYGKKKAVDKFDIIVHDSTNGKEKSFLKHSPGEKAFLSDAYTKALVKKRNDRLNRRYEPIIMDESDGPIHPKFIEAYYNCQKQYWTDNKVLIVSHSPTSYEYINQIININDLKE